MTTPPAADTTTPETVLSDFAANLGRNAAILLNASGWVTYLVGPGYRIKHFLAQTTETSEQLAYEQHYCALDPLAPAFCLPHGQYVASLLQNLRAENADHQEYRRGFMARFGIVDAMEVFLRTTTGLIIGCSLLRHTPAQPFSAEDLQRAQAVWSLGEFTLASIFPRQQASLEMISQRFPLLTPREVTLVQLVTAGLNNKQLARELDIALPTVKTHLLNVFRKLAISSRTELVARILGPL